MTSKNVDPRRDIWGALIAESVDAKTDLLANDKHLLFVGGEQSGKSCLQNGFFGRLDEPPPTPALCYQSCSLHVQESERTAHFWELGGGQKLEQLLDTIISPSTSSSFVIFLCVDVSRPKSVQDAVDFLPVLMRRFKSGYAAAFLVATHFDEFEEKEPPYKSLILKGLRAMANQFGLGLIAFSSKRDQLMSRFRSLVKWLVMPELARPEPVLSQTLPFLIYYGMDRDAGGSEVTGPFVMNLKSQVTSDTVSKKQNASDYMKDQLFAEEEIDRLLQTRERELEERLRALRASIGD